MLNRLLDVFASSKQHNVRYVVIGEIAAVLHGVPRTTFDLDILIEATPRNAQCFDISPHPCYNPPQLAHKRKLAGVNPSL